MTYILDHNSFVSDVFIDEKISELNNISVKIGKLILDKESDYFPSRSDQKVMRDDVKMSIVTAQELLKKYSFSEKTISNMPLFVSNGSFFGNFEKHLSRVLNVFKEATLEGSRMEVYKKIYRASPPLLAIETLTNSNMSFIAQYTGLKGNNATFGNTSISTYYALKQGVNEIKNGEKYCWVSSSNGANIYSHIMNRSTSEVELSGIENTGGGHIILSKKRHEDNKVLCEITKMINIKKVPKLHDQTINRTWTELLKNSKSELIIFSGAIDRGVNYKDEQHLKALKIPTISIFEKYGYLGVSNIIFGIIEGIKHIKNGIKSIDIIDRDVYGRESLIRIELC